MPSELPVEVVDTRSNPLIALAIAVIKAVLYVLQQIKSIVGWVTITLPGMIVRMLQYSFTISLTFPVLLSLFLASLGIAYFFTRYRYLARYTQLKEQALPLPPPASIPADYPDLDLGESGERRAPAFHNYLDDFLAAIRIFGYLEKPVFHELSRHLQTRRLAAGETLEIGNGDFWCVVEGKVQVFAPSTSSTLSQPPSPDPFGLGSHKAFNGYHLLNEVSTGGTLSSLFSILNLFTEDIKLAWDTPPSNELDHDLAERGTESEDEDDMLHTKTRTKTSRANSDVSQLDVGMSRTPEGLSSDRFEAGPVPRPRSSSLGSTIREDDETVDAVSPSTDTSASLPGTKSPSPVISPLQSFDNPLPPASFPSSPRPRSRNRSAPASRGPRRMPDIPPPSKARAPAQPSGADALKGTIARATVDTTLAVIPAEAFRRLTRKYPKASGTVVQVVLERFSRVTFMTAHKFLGLTREILRSESSLNALVSHPLPRSFYTGGGMQALRERFHPTVHPINHSGSSSPRKRSPDKGSKDYFNYVPASPTVRAPSLPSFTPKNAMTPAISTKELSQVKAVESLAHQGVPPPEPSIFSPDTAARQSSAFVRRNSAMRKQVAAGDLAMTRATRADENGGAYYRHTAQTPGLPRVDTWRGRMTSSLSGSHKPNAAALEVDPDRLENEYELREAVLGCIAKSIGLVQPQAMESSHLHDTFGGRSSFVPSASASAISTPNSPMFPPHVAGKGKGHFGNVLDMMNASNHHDNQLGGMLREAVMKVRNDDDASSISASIQESSAFGGEKNVLRDLEGHVEILYYKKGTALVNGGEKCPGLYYVIDGFLEVSLPADSPGHNAQSTSLPNPSASPSTFTNPNSRPFGAALGLDDPQTPHKSSHSSSTEEPLFTVKPGGIAGYLSSLCHTDSYVTITAKTDCYVGYLPNHALEKILERKPIVLLTLAKRLMSLLSPLVLHIDAALDWIQLGAREVLYEQGDKSSDFYIVINGRLRSVNVKGENSEIIREHGQGDSIGELEVITGVNRSETVHAIRDSELVRIPAALFDAISTRHPATTVQFLRLIAGRVRKAVGEQSLPTTSAAGGPAGGQNKDMNLKTVCILGANRNVPVAQFAGKLKTSLEELGASTSYLDQGTVMRHLGRHAFARIGKLKIAGWLADQEQHNRTVLYVADTPPASQWTLTCIRQADLILVLAMGDEPAIGEYEKLMLATKTTARKELILLHDERTVAPGSTRPWLINRPWLHAHHHVELPGIIIPHKTRTTVHDPAAVAAFKHLREEVKTRLKAYRGLRPLGRPRRPPHLNDFARIARRICGKSIGLCLGGGGARGISHIGMLQAMEEFGIPIDAIAGCSIGSFVGGLYSRETDLLETTGRTKQFAGRMGSVWRILSDVTYPFAAYTTGHEFNRGIYKAFYNTHIEDFWIPFFANSTNITHSRMEVHRTGYAWRYVRASMTLAGLLPPLSDNGNLLVDGGYMDNTPIGPLQSAGIRDIIVVDVGGLDDTSARNYGDSVSGWWILLNRFNPFYKRTVLSMTEVSSRLAYVSSYKTLEDAKSSPGCLYIAMPVQQFDTLGGFKSFPEVLKVGLEAGRSQLRKWKDEGVLPTGLVDEAKGQSAIRKGNRLRRMSI